MYQPIDHYVIARFHNLMLNWERVEREENGVCCKLEICKKLKDGSIRIHDELKNTNSLNVELGNRKYFSFFK